MDSENNIKTAVLGGGCFWCTEAVFKMFRGVISVTSGYAGGIKENPTYQEVSSGKTGHAEVVKIEYEPDKISFETLLIIFFATHDPTTKNRQGNDIGEQYRSIILYTDETQRKLAQNFIRELNSSNEKDFIITTEVKPFDKFYEAEQYHKDYYEKNKNQSYCEVVINPKLKKVKEKFAELLNKI